MPHWHEICRLPHSLKYPPNLGANQSLVLNGQELAYFQCSASNSTKGLDNPFGIGIGKNHGGTWVGHPNETLGRFRDRADAKANSKTSKGGQTAKTGRRDASFGGAG